MQLNIAEECPDFVMLNDVGLHLRQIHSYLFVLSNRHITVVNTRHYDFQRCYSALCYTYIRERFVFNRYQVNSRSTPTMDGDIKLRQIILHCFDRLCSAITVAL